MLPGFLPVLPPPSLVWASIPAGLLLAAPPVARPIAVALIGFGLTGVAAWSRMDDRLSPERHGASEDISVCVDSFPEPGADAIRFVARPLGRPDLPARIRLTWYDPAIVPAIGDTWRLTVRLRRPHGYANPGGFDYEGWLFREGIGATGYVEQDGRNYRIHGSARPLLGQLRRHVDERLSDLFGDDESAAVLAAVVIGARHRISQLQWDLFGRTGTSHLIAVSGLHIGLAAGSAFIVAWAFAAMTGGRCNLRDLALVAGALVAIGYAILSGFAVPARRALVMTLIAALAMLLRRRISPAHLLALTCVLVVLADPLAVLAPGFRLSFAAVAILFATAGRLVTTGITAPAAVAGGLVLSLKQLGILQLALLAGLFPLTMLEFGRFSPLAPAVNFIVVPIFNIFTVPLALAGAMFDGALETAGNQLLALARHSIRLALAVIRTAGGADLPGMGNVSPGPLLTLLLPVLHVMLPAGWPGRRIAALAIIAVVGNRPSPPPPGCFDYHALDVGQGLAVVLQTHRKTMLFDTGPSFRGGSSAARFTVLPFLERLGIGRLHALIVSHADLDHAGGLREIIRGTSVGRIRVGEPVTALGNAQSRCVAGDRWTWDGIEFELLHPRAGSPWRGNNASCVLEVSAGRHRLLLTGDIESPVEKLLAHRGKLRAADVVFVPHHGSGTSSTPPLVDATRPGLAIVSAGYGNRWGFPKAEVSGRWWRAGATVLNSATSGAVSQRICLATGPQELRETRVVERRIWHDPVAR
jgi:competence protein ComEC